MAETTLDTTPAGKSGLWKATQVRPVRSLILFGCGAAIGLGIAAYGLFTAAGTTTRMIPPEDVAMVNGRHILRSDFITQTEIETAAAFDQTTKAQRQKVLNEMLDEELLVQRGLEVDLPASDPDVRMALVNGVNLQVDADVASQQPTEDQLKAYYQAHRDIYASEGVMRIRDLIIHQTATLLPRDAYALAKQAIDDLKAGASIDDVKKKYDMVDTMLMDQLDNFDFAAKIKLGANVFNHAAALKTGEISEPFLDQGSIHVIVMVKREAPVPREYADARDTVLQDYKKAETDRLEQANIKYLHAKSDILLAPEFRQ